MLIKHYFMIILYMRNSIFSYCKETLHLLEGCWYLIASITIETENKYLF